MKYALLQKDGRVAQVVDTAEEKFPVHEDLTWVEVADDTVQEDKIVNGERLPRPQKAASQKST